uniref:Proteasome alpha-type subunits domain-containing protein n=1 Tax=Paramoeba aestuarina TaxID=180227 RepID=A0A7S4NP84_9EUKA|eukprot:CAMPEP_0201506380 /NCGR_PEP_ID=MMETSP0161_2-20130828/293_1 /ASSEMBLY_ACC=CAM_ASM_000251 /TAXON_ID=180227 /ORGANISM="Neoparamoeba aestuarina, Strain SoJaBio B1-5/56/2" /LENGTH=250 /DNA_ID=CAMNT_0047900449 /DNA_START=78 /DNA_END=830 /DNA_ORIENTATION=-
MSGVGTGYDLSASTFSPDGKIFQIQYAMKAVENSSTSIALRTKDGVIFASEKLIFSKMIVQGSNKRVSMVDRHIGVTISGLMADARQLINRCRSEAVDYKSFYGTPIPVRVMATRIANFCQVYTLYSSVRPFGASILIGGIDEKGPQLFQVDPTGISVGCYASAIGKGRQSARTELEKLKLDEMTCEEAVKEAAKIIHTIHDDVKDKPFQLDMGWISTKNGGVFQEVPKEIVAEAEKFAEDQLDGDDMVD